MWMDVMGREKPFISLLCHLHAVSFMGEALVRFVSHARGKVGAFFTSATGTRAAASTAAAAARPTVGTTSARITRYGGKHSLSPRDYELRPVLIPNYDSGLLGTPQCGEAEAARGKYTIHVHVPTGGFRKRGSVYVGACAWQRQSLNTRPSLPGSCPESEARLKRA